MIAPRVPGETPRTRERRARRQPGVRVTYHLGWDASGRFGGVTVGVRGGPCEPCGPGRAHPSLSPDTGFEVAAVAGPLPRPAPRSAEPQSPGRAPVSSLSAYCSGSLDHVGGAIAASDL